MRSRRRLVRSPAVRLALLTACIAALLSCWLGIRAVQAQHHLSVARHSVATARSAFLDRRAPAAAAAVARAGRETRRARALTSDPIWRLVARLPVAGRSLREIADLTAAADDVVRNVLPPAVTAAQLLAPDRVRRADGSFDVDLLRRAQGPVTTSADRLARVRAHLDRLPRRHVVAAVLHARDDLSAQLADLADVAESARVALAVAPPLLGSDRARTYFVLVQQTSEARGTGGLPGGFAVLRSERGRLRVLQSGSNADLRNGAVAVPPGVPADYVSAYGGNGALTLWQNVNLSPDLPVVARVVAARWRAQGGTPLDGVIALDGRALSLMMRGSPPVEVGGRRLTSKNLETYLGIGQYVGFPLDRAPARKDRIAQIAHTVADRITTGAGGDAAVRGLVDAVRTGHLRMASDDPRLGPLLERAAVTGALPAGPAPVAYAVVVNAAGGKLDYFLDRSIEYQAGPCAGAGRPSTIVVSLRNRAPAQGLPPYTTIRDVGGNLVSSTENETLLTIYGTRGARLDAATLDGQPVLVGAASPGLHLTYRVEAGLPSWQLQLSLPREQLRRVVLQLIEPAAPGAPRVPEQPLTRQLRRVVSVVSCGQS